MLSGDPSDKPDVRPDIAGERIVMIAGPTASGKSETAMLVAEALGGEIVSADSMQVYRGMDIGTAKVPPENRKGIPHHLIDIADPVETFTVGRYRRLAREAIDDILRRGRIPVVCGGTGLYLESLLEDIDHAPPPADFHYRRALQAEAEEQGHETMWQRLRQSDPDTAARLSPNDTRRILRALEVQHSTGLSMSWHVAHSRGDKQPDRWLAFCLDHRRDLLYERINRRVREMVDSGLIDEVRRLQRMSLPKEATARQAIGYKELFEILDSEDQAEPDERTLAAAVERIAQATRRYAKRQLTWFRHMPDLVWLHDLDAPQAADIIFDRVLNRSRRGQDPDETDDPEK